MERDRRKIERSGYIKRTVGVYGVLGESGRCQGHSSLDAPSELNPPQRIPSTLLPHY